MRSKRVWAVSSRAIIDQTAAVPMGCPARAAMGRAPAAQPSDQNATQAVAGAAAPQPVRAIVTLGCGGTGAGPRGGGMKQCLCT